MTPLARAINFELIGAMKKFILLIVFYIFVGSTTTIAASTTDNERLDAAINYLLAFVADSDCTFIRNDRAHTAEEAVNHMQRKYDHFKNKIKTPEDFIRLAATKSLMSGKPYMVKTKTGRLLKSETWLLEALDVYRQKRQVKTGKNCHKGPHGTKRKK